MSWMNLADTPPNIPTLAMMVPLPIAALLALLDVIDDQKMEVQCLLRSTDKASEFLYLLSKCDIAGVARMGSCGLRVEKAHVLQGSDCIWVDTRGIPS